MRALFAVLAMLAMLTAPAVRAQTGQAETIELGLSTETILITTDFSGTALTIFGALTNPDPQVLRLGRYDIFVVLEGPPTNIVTRRKDRFAGMWINLGAQQFVNVPASYLVASTRQPRDISSTENLEQLALGLDHVRLQPYDRRDNEATVGEFKAALLRLKEQTGLFAEFPSGVQFISQSLFRATLELPANVPLGEHRARAFLFKNGAFITGAQERLRIRKSGVEQSIYEFAHDNGLAYGFICVLIALATGWLGNAMFRRS